MNNPKPCEWKSNELSRGYIADYKAFNFVDGEGVRCSLYVSGCPFHCEGCYNKAAQSFKYGKPYTKELEDDILKDIGHESVQGLTLLGGEPFLNTATCLSVVKRIRATYGETKDIWSWTGYTWDEMMQETTDKLELLSLIDVLVDGRFEQKLFDPNLAFRGSSNQRIIDVQKSLAAEEVVLYEL
ncbi:TPA: anaerobic ribonucleoside-triphosphate reductase activating protein [Listeria innocua]|nr:anaerobic ribonucleoside-triphosphate reductase activating protein [Listeria innocua]HBM3606417.1 anaerobic ribonucleoside-triphosphate reductase activating protein [Listeria innocua]HBM4182315.1 anaerobic ribonucleoside-triphosphate reductase activating protein [Listeria innocua]HBM4282981.1 anaerobic ribonucleoside-triphosphate reductase activating protein [Listeria innocua]HBM4573179.1 anaerobic ribonucleoside-triphosphate reductase activating protein [Listeria innocua]